MRATRRRVLATSAGIALLAFALVLPATVGPAQTASAAPGALQISVVIDDPSGGYTGGSAKTYSGTYDCGAGFSGNFVFLSTAAPVTISGIPEGSDCTVTGNTPVGGLLNASFAWDSISYSAQPVTIGDGTTSSLQITHHVGQHFADVVVSAAVSGPGGYTGGTSRAFLVDYTCVISSGPTTTGTVTVTLATPGIIAARPAGSTCAFSEVLFPMAGDFADPALSWTTTSFSGTATSVTATHFYAYPSGTLTIDNIVSGAGYIGAGTPFVYDYVCGADSGQIVVAANATGSAVVRSGIPCTVAQQAPAAGLLAAGFTWGSPVWATPTTITLATGSTATLVITNPIIVAAAAPSPTGRVLATSGSDGWIGQLWLGLSLLCAGFAAVAIARRRAPAAR
jgi:hypothetical protein